MRNIEEAQANGRYLFFGLNNHDKYINIDKMNKNINWKSNTQENHKWYILLGSRWIKLLGITDKACNFSKKET